MFRFITLSAVLLGVTGCVGGSMAPGTLPKGAVSGIYTTAAAQTVAACIASAIGSSVQPADDRLVIASVRHSGASYSVGPNRRDGVYPTQIAFTGAVADPNEEKAVNGCAVASVTAQ